MFKYQNSIKQIIIKLAVHIITVVRIKTLNKSKPLMGKTHINN